MDAGQQVLAAIESSKYLLLFIGAYVEGTVVMMTGGVLWRLGEVQFLPMYVALYLGDFFSDLMWYGIGYFGARRFLLKFGYIFGTTPDVIAKLERRFYRYHTQVLVFSKLTMGFGLAVGTLTVAGMLRISLWRYIIINALCGIIWILCVVLVGYYFGNLLLGLPTLYQFIVAAVGLTVAAACLGFVSKRLAKADW